MEIKIYTTKYCKKMRYLGGQKAWVSILKLTGGCCDEQLH